MMEIKFNFFNTRSGEYTRWNDSNAGMPMCSFYTHEHLKFLQYTGLKDKNGMEIYEGDVVRHSCRDWNVDEKYKVIWNKDFAGFDVFPWYDSETLFFSDYLNNEEFGNIEVIGNIYENPELLNGNE